jgi:hypothetical protein
VLKSCLVLSDIADIAFKVDNFNIANMHQIESEWDSITKAIHTSVELIASFGYNTQTLTSTNALIPIAYYIMKVGNPTSFVQSADYRETREKIRKWFTVSLIKRSFSGTPDSVLRPIRNTIRDSHDDFPLEKIVDEFRGTNKSITFADEDVESLLYSKYGQPHTFTVLSFLYPALDFRNRFHQDHVFPRSFFKRSELRKHKIPESKVEFYLENYDYIGNLQLLEGVPNEEKSNREFEEWLNINFPSDDERRDYMRRNYIPQNIDLSFANFERFLIERNSSLLHALKEVLS